MPLRSRTFAGDPKLEACLVNDPDHVFTGAAGDHVGKIQAALQIVDGAVIDGSELDSQFYGNSTAAAVLSFKQDRSIINRSYQSQADNIVGKMTISALDGEMLQFEQNVRVSVDGQVCSFAGRRRGQLF